MATEELREDVKRMRQQNATPMDFGLRIRAHPDSLIVTAQNKMRQSRTIERVISLSEKLLETTKLRSNTNSIISNRAAFNRFFEKLGQAGFSHEMSPWGNPIWRGIPKEYIAAFLRDFDAHPLNVAFQTGDLARYLENATEPKLRAWDVVIPGGDGKEMIIGPVTFQMSKRNMIVRDGMLLVSGRNARVGSRGTEREGLEVAEVKRAKDEFKRSNPDKSIPDKVYRMARSRPLLLSYVLSPNDPRPVPDQNEIIALGLSFPSFDDSDVAKRVIYRVNLVEWRSMLEEETDDDLQAEDGNAR